MHNNLSINFNSNYVTLSMTKSLMKQPEHYRNLSKNIQYLLAHT